LRYNLLGFFIGNKNHKELIMRTYSKILMGILITLFIPYQVFAIAMIGATVIRMEPASRTLVVKLQSGMEKRVVLAENAKAYFLNQPAEISAIKPGQYVVIKLCSPMNEDPWRAELVLDAYSAKQYSSYRTIAPVTPKMARGGFATSAGAASPGLPPLTGVYPNAITKQWPNNSQLPDSLKWNPVNSGTLKAQPSPMGSPAIGAVLSGEQGADPGWGGVSYETWPVSGQPGGGDGSVMSQGDDKPVVNPNQGDWAAKPLEGPSKMKVIELLGRVGHYDAGYQALYVQDLNSEKVYTVLVKSNTKILDYNTNQPLPLESVASGLIVLVSGTCSSDNVVRVRQMRVQRP
jgi:hypothetical protein